MAAPSTPDTPPAEVLQLIFSAQQPAGSQATELQPVLTVEERASGLSGVASDKAALRCRRRSSRSRCTTGADRRLAAGAGHI